MLDPEPPFPLVVLLVMVLPSQSLSAALLVLELRSLFPLVVLVGAGASLASFGGSVCFGGSVGLGSFRLFQGSAGLRILSVSVLLFLYHGNCMVRRLYYRYRLPWL